jgi:hypothetical protein
MRPVGRDYLTGRRVNYTQTDACSARNSAIIFLSDHLPLHNWRVVFRGHPYALDCGAI